MENGLRTIIYIDGFNFYYGSLKNTPNKWVDLYSLCKKYLPRSPLHTIIAIKYFTARVRSLPSEPTPNSATRQDVYLRAIQRFIPCLSVIEGQYRNVRVKGSPTDSVLAQTHNIVEIRKPEEKGSDVNLAVHLLNDAWNDEFDAAVVVSDDSDLAEALRIVKEEREKPVYYFVSSRRGASRKLKQYATEIRTIRQKAIAVSQLPSPIPQTNITKPTTW